MAVPPLGLAKQDYLRLLVSEFLNCVNDKTVTLDEDNTLKVLAHIIIRGKNKTYLQNLVIKLNKNQFDTLYPLIKGKASPGFLGMLAFYTPHYPIADHLDALKYVSKIQGYGVKWRFARLKAHNKFDPDLLDKVAPIGRFKLLDALSYMKEYPFSKPVSQAKLTELLFAVTFGPQKGHEAKNRNQKIQDLLKRWPWK